MDPNIVVYNMARAGVNVDKAPVQLADGEMTQAQNAVPGRDGSDDGLLIKRPGLVKFDGGAGSGVAMVAGAGSIPGFVGAPLGPGPSTGGTDDLRVYYLSTAAGGWRRSTDSFASDASTSVLAANAATVRSVIWNNRLYYASGATIRVFDGVKDALFSALDQYSDFVIELSVADGRLFASIDFSSTGYVLEIDTAGRATQIGAALPSSYIPHTVILHQNDLFASCAKAGSAATIYRVRLETQTTATAWTLDFTSANASDLISGLASFKGLLYAAQNTPGAAQSHVYQRSTAGVYTAVETGTNSGATYAGVDHLIVYQGALYALWDHFNPPATDMVVRKTTDGSSWSSVVTFTPSASVDIGRFVDTGGKLWAFGYNNTKAVWSVTGDSATWTTVTAGAAMDMGFGFFAASGTGPAFGATSSFVLMQSGSSLQIVNQAGTVLTLTLPTGITLATDKPPRFTLFDRYIVVTNTPSRPITVDGQGIVRVLTPLAPARTITLDDDGGAGNLTGSYLAWQTYVILDNQGNIIAESDFSPTNDTAFAAVANTLDAEGLNLSTEDITASQIYRSTAGGSTKFPWIRVDGNALTQSVSDDQTDASLSLVAAPALGTCPNLSLVASWRGRLWGVDRAAVDDIRWSETGRMYAWPAANGILVGRRGSDLRGITAIIPRRDALGVGRRESLTQITGTSNTDFRAVTLSERTGVESQETVKVFRDIAYFLGKDGVYAWSSEGIRNVSDEGGVKAWFQTGTYFNRDRFPYAYAEIDPIQGIYRLFLTNAGDSSENRWVEYNIATGKWFGPHKTGALTPTATGITSSDDGIAIPLWASSTGYLWREEDVRYDDTATAIDFDVFTKRHDGNTPNIDKAFTRIRVLTQPETTGRMIVTPYVGELDAAAATQNLQVDLTLSSQEIGRVGVGKFMQLRFREATAGQNVRLYGYEGEFHELGRR